MPARRTRKTDRFAESLTAGVVTPVQMAKRAKVNKAPVISGLEGTDITLSKQSFRIGAKIGQGGFGLIYLGA